MVFWASALPPVFAAPLECSASCFHSFPKDGIHALYLLAIESPTPGKDVSQGHQGHIAWVLFYAPNLPSGFASLSAQDFCVSLNFQITCYKVPIFLSQLLLMLFINRPTRECSVKLERDYVREERDLAMLYGVETCDIKNIKHAELG